MSEFKSLKADEKKLEKIKEEEIINTFGRESIIINCQFCSKKIYTEIEIESTWTGVLLSIVLLLVFKLLAFPLILVVIPLTQQTIHRCPACLNKVGTCNFYDILSLSDKVITFSIGTFAIIISRKVLLGIFFCVLLITICFYFPLYAFNFKHEFLDETWEDYYKFCSPDNFIKKHEQAHIYCSKYKYVDVSWNGFALRTDFDSSFISTHKASILVKMNKEDHSEDGDLYLKFNDYTYSKFKDIIFNLNRGDHIFFNATIIQESTDRQSLIAEPFDLMKGEDYIKINPHIHHKGRYSFDNNFESKSEIKKNEKIYNEIDLVADETVELNELQKESYH